MKIDILIQNLFNLLIFALLIEIAFMGIFSMSLTKNYANLRPIIIARDVIILVLAVFLCYNYSQFNVLRKTGISLNKILNTVISALVLFGMTNLVKNFFSNVRKG